VPHSVKLVVVMPHHARMPVPQEAAQLKETPEYIHVMQDTQDLPQQVLVYLVPGIFLVQLVFFREAAVTPHYVQRLQFREVALLKETPGFISVTQDSRDLPQRSPVHPVPGTALAQHVSNRGDSGRIILGFFSFKLDYKFHFVVY